MQKLYSVNEIDIFFSLVIFSFSHHGN